MNIKITKKYIEDSINTNTPIDTPTQPKTPNQIDSNLPITTLQTNIKELIKNIIDDLNSVTENNDEALLKIYSKQISKMKDIINRIKNDNKLPDDIKEAILSFIGDMTAIFERRKIDLAARLSIKFTLTNELHKPNDCTNKIKPQKTDTYYGIYISKENAEYMVKTYKSIHNKDRIKDWSVADIMVDCLDIQEVNYATYNKISIEFLYNKNRCEWDGFIIKSTKNNDKLLNNNNEPYININEMMRNCKNHYSKYLPDNFDYLDNLILFTGTYTE